MKRFTGVTLITFGVMLVGILVLSILYPTVNFNDKSEVALFQDFLSSEIVAKHNTSQDCFLVIEEKVYDVSTYIGKHPGGARSIVSRCGEEVSGIFASIHSNFAWDLLGDYYIGTFEKNNATNSTANHDLNNIEDIIQKNYAGAEVINIKPSNDIFIAKIVYQDALYEIHVNVAGEIVQVEVENDEYDWSNWDQDEDDK